MSIRVIVAATFVGLFAFGAGCDNTHCEEGAVCLDGEEVSDQRADECLMYCARLSSCEAPEAEDFERCVKHCQRRFRDAPRETAELCACAERSRCEDLVEGRCSPHPGGGGSGGTAGGQGGQPGGGTGGSSCGGAGGTAGGSAGGTAGTGGSAGGASDAGVAGSAGTSSAPSCTRDCDCPLPDLCRGGECVSPEAAN